MATKKKAAKSKTKSNKKKAGKKKVKKDSKYVCSVCGRTETIVLEETIDGTYGWVETEDLICCGEEMKAE